MDYNPDLNAFIAAMQNVSGQSLLYVRVEVRLSNGAELAIDPVHLAPDEIESFLLAGSEEPFDTWSAYVEVGQQGATSDAEYGPGGAG